MKKLFVKKSKIHGNGLFIGEDSLKDSFVAYIQGKLSTVEKDLLRTPEEARIHPDWVGFSMSYWIDPAIPFKYINHSCEPSCGIKGKKSLYALRDLKEGEEITIDYSTVEGNPYWKIKCLCGSKKCRGTIRSILNLPIYNFKKYYPFIPTKFKSIYVKYKHLNLEKIT